MFRFVFGIDVIVAAIALFFFVWGIAEGTVSDFNFHLWLLLLGGIGAVLFGSYGLFKHGHRGFAIALALLPAVPAAGYVLLMAVLLGSGARWN